MEGDGFTNTRKHSLTLGSRSHKYSPVLSTILHHVTYAAAKFEVAISNGLGGDVTQNFAQYPLHHVAYAATKFEVATSKGLGGDTFTRNVTD